MSSLERLHLRWNDFESNIKLCFSELRKDEEFFDITIACGPKQIKAHKVILSACSPFFRSLIKSISHPHPLLYLRGIKFDHLELLICFMYNGEVSVIQEELNDFLAIAEELQIKGLSQNASSSSIPSANESPSPNKRARVQNKVKLVSKSSSSSRSESPTITIIDDDKTPHNPDVKEEHKFIFPNVESSLINESADFDQELHEEKVSEDEEYAQESDNVDFGSDNSVLESDYSGASGSSSVLVNQPKVSKDNRFFHLNETIKRHIKKSESGVYMCTVCKKSSHFISNIKKHVESKHIVTDGFRCEDCNLICKTRATLRSHRLKKHPPGPVYVPTNFEDEGNSQPLILTD